MKAVFLADHPSNITRVFPDYVIRALKAQAEIPEKTYNKDDILAKNQECLQADVAFSTWGIPILTEEEIRTCLPNLKALFYAAGSVQHFARPYLKNNVRVFSAWAANGIPVAEYTVAQIVLAAKGFFSTTRYQSIGCLDKVPPIKSAYPGNFGITIGIIGAGMIGRNVIRLLKNYNHTIKVFDPFLSDKTALDLGVEKCDLPTLFEDCFIVTNHLANNEQTQGILTGELFSRMQPYATFINTGRGAQVVEKDLIDVLSSRPDLTAILDVTYPEPPVTDSPFYKLENCILTPHIAGSIGNETYRMAEFMAQEFNNYYEGKPCQYEVSIAMLDTMA